MKVLLKHELDEGVVQKIRRELGESAQPLGYNKSPQKAAESQKLGEALSHLASYRQQIEQQQSSRLISDYMKNQQMVHQQHLQSCMLERQNFQNIQRTIIQNDMKKQQFIEQKKADYLNLQY